MTTDYAGVKKPASKIVWEAAQAWNLNPKVILATLQKEQSLLAKPNPSAKTSHGGDGMRRLRGQ